MSDTIVSDSTQAPPPKLSRIEQMASNQLDLFVPDRFDILFRRAETKLNTIITPVDDALRKIDDLAADMRAAGRGAFLILRGESGAGKSTFLNTVHLFRKQVEELSIPGSSNLAEALNQLTPSLMQLRIISLEGREALKEVKDSEIEANLHAINSFIRGAAGEKTLIVWPCNTDDLKSRLINLASKLGADSLLGIGEPAFGFTGPQKSEFIRIATQTIHTLNEGASLADLGVSQIRTDELLTDAKTIGAFLGHLRQDLRANRAKVENLLATERCRMWVIVAAGNDPDNEVSSLTRGGLSTGDIDKMMGATDANIVAELKKKPSEIGILGTTLDAKILHLPMITALTSMRTFADSTLKSKMAAAGMSTSVANDAVTRLQDSEIAHAFRGEPLGPRSTGSKPGSNTVKAFESLAEIASSNDSSLNRALGEALKKADLITDFKVEQDLGTGLRRRTDILCETTDGPIRLELMWRRKTSRAEIANYVLAKLSNYGKAIGYLT
ncbi:MAG TPA: hypothetical protein VHM90_07860 [Phycisphaerae bacterium]|nr:hypothetical protein [Phycisphaerae bacterium]